MNWPSGLESGILSKNLAVFFPCSENMSGVEYKSNMNNENPGLIWLVKGDRTELLLASLI